MTTHSSAHMRRRSFVARLVTATLIAISIAQGPAIAPAAASARPPSPPLVAAPAAPTPVVPYGAAGWKYQVVSQGGQPGFEVAGFNDAGWPVGSAPFGSPGACPVASGVATTWAVNSDLLLRRSLSIPAGTQGVEVWVVVDNDAIGVYWNGALIGGPLVHEGCANADQPMRFAIDAASVTGSDVLAIRLRDRGSESYGNVQVVSGAMPNEPATCDVQCLENGGFLGDPVQSFSGAFIHSWSDLTIPGRGPAPSFGRSYNSRDSRIGPMGPGWMHNYAARLRHPGDGSADLLFVGPDGNTDRFTRNGDETFSAPAAVDRTLVRSADGTFVVTEPSQARMTFDASGSLTSIIDRFGNASTLGYNAGGELVSISDPAGRGSLALAYTAGKLTSVADWASPARTVTYQYDAQGRLWRVTDREGAVTTFGYDGTSARLSTITDARGNVALTLTYDAQGRVATQRDAKGVASGATTTFAYVVNGDGTRVTTLTEPPTSFEPAFSPTTVDTYTAQGWLVSRVARPSSSETLTESHTYDANGFRASSTNPRGARTDYCYDRTHAGATIAGSRGNLTRIIAPAPTAGANRPVTLLAYDSKRNVTQTVAPAGVPSGSTVSCSTNLSAFHADFATDLAYDAAGAKLLSSTSRYTDPDAGAMTAVTKYEYGDVANPGSLTRIIPPRGNTTGTPDYTYAATFTYFGSGVKAGMLATSVDALGNTTTFDYDAVGRLVSSVDPLGNAAGGVPAEHRTEVTYDKEDRVRFVKLPAPVAGGSQLVSESRYDAVGNPIVAIDANGQVTTSAYDERDALLQVKQSPNAWTDPAAPPAAVITTEYAYDAAGRMTRMTRAKGDAANERVTDYAYDGRGLVRRETQFPSWPTTTPTLVATSTYDPAGNLATTTDQLGRTTTMSHDLLDRPTAIDYSDAATPDVAYGYDPNNNRTSMVDGTGTSTYAYDELGRLLSVASPGPKVVGYRYDRDGNRTKLIYPDATAVTYTFDKAARMSGLTDWASRAVAYTYFADGAIKDATNPNGTAATYDYDNARRLTDNTTKLGSTTLTSHAYTLDPTGNVTALDDGGTGFLSTRRASLTNTGTQGNGAADNPAVTGDGRYVAFASAATNLVAGDTNGVVDIFVRDLVVGTTTRVSVSSGGTAGNGASLAVDLTEDGRFVVFESLASNLVTGDTNGVRDIFLRDIQAGTTERISVALNNGQSSDTSWWPTITPDGRYVVFESEAGNLVAGDTNAVNDIFLRDRQTGTTTRVNVSSNGTQANALSQHPGVTPDGRYIVFASTASNLVADDTNGTYDVFLHDRQTATTTRISMGTAGAQSNNISYWPSLTNDARYIVFASSASNLIAGDTNGAADVFIHDRQSGTTSRVSVSSTGAQSNGASNETAVSADGRYVAFESTATNLVAGDTNALQDIFVHDRQGGTTSRVSVATGGAQASGDSFEVAWGSQTRFVVYESAATNLAPDDTNGANDVFITDLGNPFTTYGYDRLSRLTSVSDPAIGSGAYTYDPAGNRTSRTRDGSTYTYDRADRISSVVGAAIPGSSTRAPSSNDAGWTSAANAYTANDSYATSAPNKNNSGTVNLGTFGFDALIPANATISGVTVTVEWKVSTAASIATLGAQATVNGTPVGSELVNTAEPTTDTSQSFAIPGLTRAQLLNGVLGVRVRATRGNSNTAFTASLDAVSVKVDYSASSVTTLSVNAVGATTARGADTFTYDQANRLKTATVAGVTETSTYDGDGVRFSRQVGTGPITRYVSDPTAGLPVTIDDGTRKYVWGASGLAYAVAGAAIEVQHADRLGSIRAVTDGTGAVIATFRTDEFGIPTASTGAAGSPFRYTGESLDASGLTYLRARYYDPSIGRFLSRDPFAGFASSPLSLNRYSYVANNPATWSDPSGLAAPGGGGMLGAGPKGKPQVLSCGGEAHGVLDLGGLLNPLADASNAIIYVCEGDWGGAAISGISVIPVLDFLKLLRRLGKAENALGAAPDLAGLSAKITRQMERRGWTKDEINEAWEYGIQFDATNLRTGGDATRYVHPVSGQSVVIDDITGEVIHVGGPGFDY